MESSRFDDGDRASSVFSTRSISESFHNIIDDSRDPTKAVRDASIFSCYCNMINSIMGAGILGLPYAFANTGWVFGILLNLISAYFAILGCRLLSFCSSVTPAPTSFFNILHVINPHATIIVDISVALLTCGSSTAYLIIIGDLMPASLETLGASGMWIDRTVWVIIGFIVATPFSCLHNLDALKWTSGFCFLFLLFTIMVVVIYSVPNSLDACADQGLDDDGPCRGEHVMINTDAFAFLKVFSVFIFAIACQANIFAFINEIRNPTEKRLNHLFSCACLSACVCYVTYGVCGYVTYGDAIRSDSIVNYPRNNLDAVVGIFMSYVVALSYPLQMNPCRRSLLTLLQSIFNKKSEPTVTQIRFRYFGITTLFLAITLVIALSVSDLGVVIAFVGATGSTMIMFIIPGWAYLELFSWKGCEEKRTIARTSSSLKAHLLETEKRLDASQNIEDILDLNAKGLSQDSKMASNIDTVGNKQLFAQEVHQVTNFYVIAAWVQLILGIILMPICIVAIFI